MRLKKAVVLCVVAGALALIPVASSGAAPLADNCDRVQGEVICTTFDGPGNNQAGVGETTVTETQGNTTNDKPLPQDDGKDAEFCNPPSSNGKPCNP